MVRSPPFFTLSFLASSFIRTQRAPYYPLDHLRWYCFFVSYLLTWLFDSMVHTICNINMAKWTGVSPQTVKRFVFWLLCSTIIVYYLGRKKKRAQTKTETETSRNKSTDEKRAAANGRDGVALGAHRDRIEWHGSVLILYIRGVCVHICAKICYDTFGAMCDMNHHHHYHHRHRRPFYNTFPYGILMFLLLLSTFHSFSLICNMFQKPNHPLTSNDFICTCLYVLYSCCFSCRFCHFLSPYPFP